MLDGQRRKIVRLDSDGTEWKTVEFRFGEQYGGTHCEIAFFGCHILRECRDVSPIRCPAQPNSSVKIDFIVHYSNGERHSFGTGRRFPAGRRLRIFHGARKLDGFGDSVETFHNWPLFVG
jgi:hypothetical protein